MRTRGTLRRTALQALVDVDRATTEPARLTAKLDAYARVCTARGGLGSPAHPAG
jgi:hypothetical protein